MSYDTINRWLSRIDKDEEEERLSAVQNLYLQCYTLDEIAESVGTPKKTIHDLCADICNYKIPHIPGIYTEDLPDDSAPAKVKKKAEEERQTKITEEKYQYSACLTSRRPSRMATTGVSTASPVATREVRRRAACQRRRRSCGVQEAWMVAHRAAISSGVGSGTGG